MNRCTEFGRCAAGVQGGVLAERSTRGRGWNRCAGRGQLLDEQGASQALLVVPLGLDEVTVSIESAEIAVQIFLAEVGVEISLDSVTITLED